MERKHFLEMPLIRPVLFMICLSVAGCGIAAAIEDSSAPLVQGTQVIPGERCDQVREICGIFADVPLRSCEQECSIKHLSKGDIIGKLICDGWCKTNIRDPSYHTCLAQNRCE